jgi:hypothetical protein
VFETLLRRCVHYAKLQERHARERDPSCANWGYTNGVMWKRDVERLRSSLPDFIEWNNLPKLKHSPSPCINHRTIDQKIWDLYVPRLRLAMVG